MYLPLPQYILRKACLAPEDPARLRITINNINSLLDRLATDTDTKKQVGGVVGVGAV